MKYDVLKASFLPKFTIKTEKYNKTFILSSAYGLHLGIMIDSTNGLGYDKIRKSRKTNITTDELYSHLKKMDEETQSIKDRILKSFTGELIYLWDEEKNYLNKVYDKLGEIKKDLEERFTGDEFTILEYKSQLKQKDAEIERLRNNLSKKSLFSKVFG